MKRVFSKLSLHAYMITNGIQFFLPVGFGAFWPPLLRMTFLRVRQSFGPADSTLWIGSVFIRVIVMISTKILVYRSPDGAKHTEALLDTRRRKKSCSELFHNGYRVKMLHHAPVCEKEERDDSQYTLSSCLHAVSYWGKNWCWNPDGCVPFLQEQLYRCLLLIRLWFLRHGTKQNAWK